MAKVKDIRSRSGSGTGISILASEIPHGTFFNGVVGDGIRGLFYRVKGRITKVSAPDNTFKVTSDLSVEDYREAEVEVVIRDNICNF